MREAAMDWIVTTTDGKPIVIGEASTLKEAMDAAHAGYLQAETSGTDFARLKVVDGDDVYTARAARHIGVREWELEAECSYPSAHTRPDQICASVKLPYLSSD